MTPERWAKIEEIFQAALDCPPTVRASFLDEQCGDDPELCTEVENLILRYDTGSPFLETPVWSDPQFFQTTLKNKIASSFFEDDETNNSLVGQSVGAYRLIEEIGRGGMGVVYLAARETDFQQKVAVKIVKRGMDTDFVLRRFRQERQALAALEHPNIARLLDGGSTADGRPFLVMEYVEGVSIDRFCDENKLTIKARLQLFRRVCAAVAYSHQRLVIHRDIKPSNVLVTKDGEPKLLDFGIAKLLDRSMVSVSYQTTAANARMLTPDYASPEQLRGETVTTVSDVYSLGVMLYFLLTGNLPFNFASGHQPEAFARIVSEEKPERPSAVVTHGGKTTAKNTGKATNNQSLAEVADNRRTQPERLRRYLADDLDNIVLKALRKETARRYSSVEQLAEDIERHLSGLPVAARGDDFVYKTRKFLRRHKAGVLAVGLLIITLLSGISATVWQARIADKERARAEAESSRAKNRFNESRRLTESLMFELSDAIRDLQGATAARELLAKRTLEHLDQLAAEAENDADLQSELAIAYINLGNIQGNPFYPNLGDTNGALASYRKAEKLTETLLSANPNDLKLQRRFWLTQIRIGDVLSAQGDLDNAKKIYADALALIENLAKNNPGEESFRNDLASSYDRQGNISVKINDFSSALEAFEKALRMFEKSSAANPNDDVARRAVAAGHGKIGTVYLKSGAPEKALPSYQKLLQINRTRLEKNPSNAVMIDDTAGSWRELGDAQAALGDYQNAFESYCKQLQMYQQLAAADEANVKANVETAISYQRLALLQTKVKDLRNALENHEKSLAILRLLEAKNPQNTFVVNQLPPVFFYLGEVNFALAGNTNQTSAKINFLRAARAFFEQSRQAYAELPASSRIFPDSIRNLTDIENRLDECDSRLEKQL